MDYEEAEAAYHQAEKAAGRAREKASKAYQVLKDALYRRITCPHNHCAAFQDSVVCRDEIGPIGTDYYRSIICKDCAAVLAKTIVPGTTYMLGWTHGVVQEGDLLELAPWWYVKRGGEIRGYDRDLPRIKQITTTQTQTEYTRT